MSRLHWWIKKMQKNKQTKWWLLTYTSYVGEENVFEEPSPCALQGVVSTWK